MNKIKKINYLLFTILCLLFIVYYFLSAAPAQSQFQKPEIVLTWSTNTYVPLDYPGKALAIKGSIVEVAANVFNSPIDINDLYFRWLLNENTQLNQSGKGKPVFRFAINWRAYGEQSVRLEIKNSQGTILGSAYTSINLVEPQISIESSSYSISANQEAIFKAQPYFFNIKNLNELNYEWRFDRKTAPQDNPNNPNIFILKIGELAESLKKNLRVKAEKTDNQLEYAQIEKEILLIP